MGSVNQRLFGRTVIDSLELNQNAWWIDSTKITVTGTQLNQLATTKFVTASTLGTDVAGTGIGGGSGSALTLDLSELSAATFDPATDYLPFIDNGDSSSKKSTWMNIVSLLAGNGMWSAAGVFGQGSYGMVPMGFVLFTDVGDCDAISVNSILFTRSATPGATNGEWTEGASSTASATNFAAAVNADTRNTGSTSYYYAVRVGDAVFLLGKAVGVTGMGTIALTGAAPTQPSTLQNVAGGLAKVAQGSVMITHTVTAAEVTAEAIVIPLPFTTSKFILQARTAAGAAKYITDTMVLGTSPAQLTIAKAGAGDHLANTDVVTIYISE